MAIIRNINQFHIQTKHTSYILAIYQDKYPVHLYWGERLEEEINLEYQTESIDIDRAAYLSRQLKSTRTNLELVDFIIIL